MVTVSNALQDPDITLGLISAEMTSVDTGDGLDEALEMLVEERKNGLGHRAEESRLAARDMLRFGTYKPTGRGKPASEYLLRAATSDDGVFPRINYVVDVCNLISLKYLVPVSLWDRDHADSDIYRFRRGLPAEEYEFNKSGQLIRLEDLAVGCVCASPDDPLGVPIVSPIKDCQRTKTDGSSRRILAVIYVPTRIYDDTMSRSLCSEFAELLSRGDSAAAPVSGVCPPGERAQV